jgi:hypothetical protein
MKKVGFGVFATIRCFYVSLSTYNHPSIWELWDKQINRRYDVLRSQVGGGETRITPASLWALGLVCFALLSPGMGILLPACWHISIFVPSLQTFICHGDFLLANISPNAEAPTVCRIQKAQHPDQLIVVWWMSHAELSSRGILQYPPSILMERYTNILNAN